MIKKFWWVGVVVVVAGAALLYYLRGLHHEPVMVPADPAPPPAAAATEAPPAIENPVPSAAAPGETPLPALDESDKPLASAIAQLIGSPVAQKILRPETLVRHIVATVDNLNRPHAGLSLRPVTNVPGRFAVLGDEIHSTLDPSNFQRYTPYVQLVQKTDLKQLTALYFRYYPLFQQAYEDLGYPKGYFNDELVKSLDSMLATPDAPAIIDLVQPNVNYQFADPALENLTAGQKILLRIGPLNAAIVKARLRELRTLVAKAPAADAASAATATAGPAATSSTPAP